MFGTYNRLNVSVNASNLEVIRKARLKLSKRAKTDPEIKDARKAFYRVMLEHHRTARALFHECRF